ncbi:MAG: hypothetical protein II938_04765 [Alphaproteobacteria bacterium]|nr:hypothetical protein [Alphaproteobacteria bacterium]
MDIFLKIFKIMLSTIINIIVFGGLIIVLAWAIWDITPQTSITKTAYFFSESWRIITGRPRTEYPEPIVTEKQLKQSEKQMRYIYSK